MIILLDTSTPICKVTLVDGDDRFDDQWQADRELAKGLLGYIKQLLENKHKTFSDITGIGVFKGPGSFTGLRIGMTVMNTMADGLDVPIVGEMGDGWQQRCLDRLAGQQNDQIVLPVYGGEANITKPRK